MNYVQTEGGRTNGPITKCPHLAFWPEWTKDDYLVKCRWNPWGSFEECAEFVILRLNKNIFLFSVSRPILIFTNDPKLLIVSESVSKETSLVSILQKRVI